MTDLTMSQFASKDDLIAAQAARIAELEAEVDAERRHHGIRNASAVRTLHALGYSWRGADAWHPAEPREGAHPDDAAVDALAALMKAKLGEKRAKGYGGWNDKTLCPQQRLSDMLRAHVDKGDPVDVANFCAMLSARGEGIAAAPHVVQERKPLTEDQITEAWENMGRGFDKYTNFARNIERAHGIQEKSCELTFTAQQAVQAAVPEGWKLAPIKVPDSAFAWVSGGYPAGFKAWDKRDTAVVHERAQRAWEAILNGITAPAHPAEGVPAQAAATQPAAQGMEAQQYRLIKHGELIEAGDQFLRDDFTWQIDPRGIFVGVPYGAALRPARRALAAQAKQGGA